MRKIFLLLMIIFAVSGCGNDDKAASQVGAITQLNTTPQAGVTFFDNFNSMQMALASNNIAAIQTYGSVAKYMTANNSDFAIKETQTVKLVDNFCCALREDDSDLKNAFDAAIDAMKADGSLDALIDKYITNFATPTPIDIPKIDGAEVIKVGVTGDLPPLDLVLADGTPALVGNWQAHWQEHGACASRQQRTRRRLDFGASRCNFLGSRARRRFGASQRP